MKICKKCGDRKPLEAFYVDNAARDGRRPECKECTKTRQRASYQANREIIIKRVIAWQRENREKYNAKQREYRRRHREAERAGHLNRTFGLTQADYEALLEAQGGGCAICGRPPGKISLHIDHDHETGKVRGLRCFRCNGGAGQFKEDVELLARAIDYLDSGGLVEAIELEQRARERARELVDASR